MWQVFGAIGLGALMIMPFLGIIPCICIMTISFLLGKIFSDSAEEKEERKTNRHRAQYPTYKYSR